MSMRTSAPPASMVPPLGITADVDSTSLAQRVDRKRDRVHGVPFLYGEKHNAVTQERMLLGPEDGRDEGIGKQGDGNGNACHDRQDDQNASLHKDAVGTLRRDKESVPVAILVNTDSTLELPGAPVFYFPGLVNIFGEPSPPTNNLPIPVYPHEF